MIHSFFKPRPAVVCWFGFFFKENFVNQSIIICEAVKGTLASGCLEGEIMKCR